MFVLKTFIVPSCAAVMNNFSSGYNSSLVNTERDTHIYIYIYIYSVFAARALAALLLAVPALAVYKNTDSFVQYIHFICYYQFIPVSC